MNIFTVELTNDVRDFLIDSPDYYITHISKEDWTQKKYVAIKTYKEQVEWVVTNKGRVQPYQYFVKPCNVIQGFLVSYEDFMALQLMPNHETFMEYLKQCRKEYKMHSVHLSKYLIN